MKQSNTLDEIGKNWEGLAQTDPMWAILTDPRRAGRRWETDEFFATGEYEITAVFDRLRRIGAAVGQSGIALDFGCGLGRLTQALSSRFQGGCVGIDISATMIENARRLNRHGTLCKYVLNDRPDLSLQSEGHYSFIYSSVVLQHIDCRSAERYIVDFVRVLRPGGMLVFQVLDSNKRALAQVVRDLSNRVRVNLALRTRVNRILRRGRPGPERASGDFRMEMNAIPERRVRRLISAASGRIIDVSWTNSTDSDFNGKLRYLDRESAEGFVSKQYCVIRDAIARIQAERK